MRPTRRRHRLRVVLLSPVWVTVFVIGLLLAVQNINAGTAIEEFETGQYAEAVDGFDTLDGVNMVERWKAPFNLGTARYMDGDPWLAVSDLERALERVPDEDRCMVQINLALALEAGGDSDLEQSREYRGWAKQAQAYVDAGEEYPDDAPWYDDTPEELRDSAIMWADFAAEAYADARIAREDPACAQQQSPEEQEQNEQSQDQLQEKQEQAEREAGQDQEQEPEPTQSPEEAEAERQAELAERNAEAASEAEAERQEQAAEDAGADSEGGGDDGDGTGGGGTQGW